MYSGGYSNKINNRETVVAIDPGVNKFISYYSDSTYGYIGGNVTEILKKDMRDIQKYDKILLKNKNKEGMKLKNKKIIKIKRQNSYDKIVNKVKELHNQTALYLCKNYETIVIPKLEVTKLSNVKKEIKRIKEPEQTENIKREQLKVLQKKTNREKYD